MVELCSIPTGVPYFAPLKGLVLLVFVIPLCFQHPQAIRTLLTRKGLLHPCLWITAIVAAVVVCYIAGIQENLVLLSPKRDPITAKVTLDTFLNYGRPTVATMLAGLVTGGIPIADNTYYIGLLPLAMAAYALVTQKGGAFLGIICAFGMLFWLSLGGVFASAVYYLPGMALFRHIGLVFGLGGLLLLLASGYGIDRLAGVMSGSAVAPPPRLGNRLAWLGLVAGLMLLDFLSCRRPNDGDVMSLHPAWKPFFAFRLLIYADRDPGSARALPRPEAAEAVGPDPRPAPGSALPARHGKLSSPGVVDDAHPRLRKNGCRAFSRWRRSRTRRIAAKSPRRGSRRPGSKS